MSNSVKTALGILIAAVISFLGVWQTDLLGTETTVETPAIVDASNEVGKTKRLGVNFTWSQIQQINGQRKEDEAWRNYTPEQLSWVDDARFFVYMSKDFRGRGLGNNELAIRNLRRLMPNATIWITFESPDQGDWPLKCFNADWWGDNPRLKACTYFSLYFELAKEVGGPFVFQATNEEFPHTGTRRVAVYDMVRMGMVDAHRMYQGSNVMLSTGCRSYANREYRYNGIKQPISESILDLEPQYLKYIDSVCGYVDYHLYAETYNNMYYVLAKDLHGHHDFEDLKLFLRWVSVNMPNTKAVLGETTNLMAKHKTVLPVDVKIKSFTRLADHLDTCYTLVNTQILYQIENHGKPEGKFTDSGVLPWIDSLKVYKKKLN